MTFRTPRFAGITRLATTVFSMVIACTLARGDDGAPAAAAKPRFEPGDIAIGDPIALPFAAARTEIPSAPAPTPPSEPTEPRSLLTDPEASAATRASQSRGTGWIGLQIAESTEPGRWAVSEVAAGGPAATTGITVGDEVRAINGVVLRSAEDVAQALTALAAGQQVTLALARGGQPIDISLLAVERPVALSSRTWQSSPEPAQAADQAARSPSFDAPPPPFASSPRFATPLPTPSPPSVRDPLPPPASMTLPSGRTALGVRTLPIDPELQSRFKLSDSSGAYVIGVVQDLPASKAGVPPGSVIVSLDNRPVRSPDDLTRLVTLGPVGRPVTLQYVLPGGASHRADVVLQSLERPLEAALVGPEPMSPTPAPQFQPGPPTTTSQRPVNGGVHNPSLATEARAIGAEIRDLRFRLEQLERRLETIAP